ncbi:MAG: esterase-like activity of phytase family protein [Ahrensia sp.]|nr:esterase-like activity of phytase family protein [Ahrensia sp.]
MGKTAIFTLVVTIALMPTPEVYAQESQVIEIKSRKIEHFKIGSDQSRFGPLEFIGGLEMTSSSRDFGAWSGISIAPDQTSFVGVADTGFWITGQIERDASNVPIGVTAKMQEISGADGTSITAKWQADAEGIALSGTTALVSYERAHRIAVYDVTTKDNPLLLREFAPPVPLYELRDNRGFEAIALAPETSPSAGALVGVSEKSLDKNQNIMAFVQPIKEAPFEFSVKRIDEFDVTDMAFTPSGDMVLLERRFNVSDGIGMRLRRIKGAALQKGKTVDGEILFEADMGFQIDNLEGMDITADADGSARITLVSDDNHSLLQRNLLLEFKLIE